MHDRVLNNLPRTNNSVESWHKQFELCCTKHPGVWKLIQCFREEQKLAKIELIKIKSGKFVQKTNIKEIRIYYLCKNYKREEFWNFIEGMISNLEF